MKPTILFILHLPLPVHGAAMVGKYIHDSRVINESFDCHYINLTTARDLSDIGKVGLRKIKQCATLLRRIRREIKRLRPCFVYVTPNACGGAFYKDFIVVKMLKRMGCRVVVHYHNKGVATRQDRLFDDFLYRKFFKGLKVILLAEALYQDIKKYVCRDDVYICPNGIPETLADKAAIERNNKIPHLLFLSNLLESKGVLVLLDACKILKDRGYSFVCDFVGSETAEIDAARFIREVEKRGLNKQVIYQGKKYGSDKEPFWQYADIFVFPTFYCNECFPLVLLEAMQHGVACISTAEGGIPDIIEDGKTGFVIEKQNPELLVGKIEQLINTPQLMTQFGLSARKRFEERFTLNVFESRIKHIFDSLIVVNE
ncbi:glycosyltransferase family 4 protein [Bacteroides sp. AN502(2024)]|uniref:glycosyltransferase family 4 protein n=1 Tax=Bacteroides sp. AN502(2024) TaxID=3160599 RepID=UPI0035183241